jgi:hypothetical protein
VVVCVPTVGDLGTVDEDPVVISHTVSAMRAASVARPTLITAVRRRRSGVVLVVGVLRVGVMVMPVSVVGSGSSNEARCLVASSGAVRFRLCACGTGASI